MWDGQDGEFCAVILRSLVSVLRWLQTATAGYTDAGGHTELLLTQGVLRKQGSYFETWKAELC